MFFSKSKLNHTPFWPGTVKWKSILWTFLPVGILFALDIVLVNVTFKLSTISLAEIVRSGMPILVLFFSALFFRESLTMIKITIMVILATGIAMTTYGQVGFNPRGFIAAIFATVFGALKLIFLEKLFHNPSNIQVQNVHPIVALFYISPIIFFSLVIPFLAIEAKTLVHSSLSAKQTAILLTCSAVLAFSAKLSEVYVVEKTSALSFTVASICRLILVVVISALAFGESFSLLNGFGIAVCIIGVFLYNWSLVAKMSHVTTDPAQAEDSKNRSARVSRQSELAARSLNAESPSPRTISPVHRASPIEADSEDTKLKAQSP